MKVWEGKRLTVLVEHDKAIVVAAPAVAIVAVDGDGRFVLVRQQREAVGATLLELPAGIVDDGEEPAEAAKRELAEETGLRGGLWRELRRIQPSPGFLREAVTLFVAEELEEGKRDLDSGEEVEVRRLTRGELEAELPRLEDAKTLVGLLLYLRDQT